ncbi:MAG: helix-turn-helix domain-containing protein [Actinomycetota bacterium]
MRQAKGLTQEELAHQAEIHPTYLSGVEVGKRSPSSAVLDRIAAALGDDISAFFVQPQRIRRAQRTRLPVINGDIMHLLSPASCGGQLIIEGWGF